MIGPKVINAGTTAVATTRASPADVDLTRARAKAAATTEVAPARADRVEKA
jgi:hypothetical protein